MLNKVYSNKTFQSALPWIMLIVGLISLLYGIFNKTADENFLAFARDSGKAILTGGVFAVLLKSMQFMGVFKEAILSIIYEPQYLENRKDLPSMWEKLSMVLFKNKFPKISDKLLHDVKEMYFPTKEVIYYENAEHELKFKILDKDNSLISVTATTNLDVICESKTTKTFYEHGFSTDCTDYKMTKFKVDGNDTTKSETSTKNIDGVEYHVMKTKLAGKEKYRINLVTERTIDIAKDDLFQFGATKIFNKLKIQIHFDKGLSFDFHSLGTLKNFSNTKNHEHFREFVYDGLIYVRQGYYFKIKLQ